MGYVIDLIVIGRHGDRLWQFHSGRSAHHALAVMEQFAGHLHLHLQTRYKKEEKKLRKQYNHRCRLRLQLQLQLRLQYQLKK